MLSNIVLGSARLLASNPRFVSRVVFSFPAVGIEPLKLSRFYKSNIQGFLNQYGGCFELEKGKG